MRLLVGDDIFEFSDDDLDWLYVEEGNEATVYQFRGEALKIYKSCCDKLRLSESDVIKLSKLTTSRVLLPRRLIRNLETGDFLGYTTEFIHRAATSGITKMNMGNFLAEVDLLRSDVMMLADHNVDVEDFNLGNTAYNGGIYLFDPGSYSTVTNPTEIRYVRGNNSMTLNNYVIGDIFGMIKLTKAQRKNLETVFSCYDYIGDGIRATARCDETISQYVKRMAR